MNKKLLAIWITTLLLIVVSCNGNGGNGGITIPQSDNTGPTLSLGTGQPNGQNITVSDGGSAQNMQLISKTGALNLLVTATDPESGIQAVEIWIAKRSTSCDANGICTTVGPGLLGMPRFESTTPQKQPGETTAASSILAEALDLAGEIPQGNVSGNESLSVDIIIFAVAKNHLGGQTQTPEITATWSEP